MRKKATKVRSQVPCQLARRFPFLPNFVPAARGYFALSLEMLPSLRPERHCLPGFGN